MRGVVMKKEVDEQLQLLKKKIQDGKVLIGSNAVLKTLKAGTSKKVFIASNCPQDVKQSIQHYAQLTGIPLIELEQNNEELGIFCKKNYFVSVVAVMEE